MQQPPTHTSAPQPARGRKDRAAHTRNTHATNRDAQTPSQHNTHPRPPHNQQCHLHTTPFRPPPRDQATDATRGSLDQLIDVDAPADTHHRGSPLPRPPQETPSTDPIRDNDDHRPQPTPPPQSHPAPPAAAPAEPYALHNPAAVRQHLWGLGDQEVLRPHTFGTTQRIQAITLVQAASLGEGVRDFLFDSFLHVDRHDRPPLATPDSESPLPTGDRIWVPPINSERHLVGHPVPEREDTQGRTRYREPNIAHPPPSATPSNTKEWERETWVARMASLSNLIQTPDDRQPAPSTYMTLMYNLHYTVSTTHYHAPTGHWVVHGTDSLLPAEYAPPPHNPGLDTYAREGEPDDTHISGNQGLDRAMYCLAKWTQRT